MTLHDTQEIKMASLYVMDIASHCIVSSWHHPLWISKHATDLRCHFQFNKKYRVMYAVPPLSQHWQNQVSSSVSSHPGPSAAPTGRNESRVCTNGCHHTSLWTWPTCPTWATHGARPPPESSRRLRMRVAPWRTEKRRPNIGKARPTKPQGCEAWHNYSGIVMWDLCQGH